MTFCLYSVRNLVNGKGYIGQSREPHLRWKRHCHEAKGFRSYLLIHKAIRKYGPLSFSYEPMMLFDSEDEMNAAEVYMIHACETNAAAGRGYNVAPGGHLGFPMNEKAKRKLSLIGKARYLDPAERERNRVAQKVAHSRPEVKAKTSASAKARWLDPVERARGIAVLRESLRRPEVRARISAAAKVRFLDPAERERNRARQKEIFSRPEIKAKMSLLRKGRTFSKKRVVPITSRLFGRPVSPATRQKLAAVQIGRRHQRGQEWRDKVSAGRRLSRARVAVALGYLVQRETWHS